MPVTFTITLPAPAPSTPGASTIAYIRENLVVAPDVPYSSFVVGSVEPVSDVGPWLKQGVSWHVYSTLYGRYVPSTDASAKLPFSTGPVAPAAPAVDPTGIAPTPPNVWLKTTEANLPVGWYYYTGAEFGWLPISSFVRSFSEPVEADRNLVWLQTDLIGMPVAIKRWSETYERWEDFSKFVVSPHAPEAAGDRARLWVKTVDDTPADLQAWTGTEWRSLANPRTYAFEGRQTSNQTITAGAPAARLALGTEVFDLGNQFDGTIFTAPVSGVYSFTVAAQVGEPSGEWTVKTWQVNLRRNGSVFALCQDQSSPEDVKQVTLNFTKLAKLLAGDTVDVSVEAGVATGNQEILVLTTVTTFSGHLVEEAA